MAEIKPAKSPHYIAEGSAAGVITGDYLGCGAHGFVRDRGGKITTFDPPRP